MAANVAAVDAAVIAALSADAELAALVPDGIWRDVAPPDSTRAVTVQLQTHEDIEGFRAPLYEEFRYRIVAHVLEKSGADADAAAARIHDLLQDVTLEPIDGYTHMATLRVEVVRAQDPDPIDHDLRWQLAGGDYEITVSPGDTVPPALAYADLVVADGASHYWRLGEPSGTITVDAIGTAHGTISGGVTLGQPGAISDGTTAMLFNGTTGKIVTTTNVALVPPITAECWFKTATDAEVPLFSVGTYPNPEDTIIYYMYANRYLGIRILYAGAGSQGNVNLPQPVVTSQWHHFVCVLSGGTAIAMYLNGVVQTNLVGALSLPVVGSTLQPLSIGFNGWVTQYWPGHLDEVAIYPLALTPEQIAAHYAAASSARRSRTRTRKD